MFQKYSPRNAVGESTPLRILTKMEIPVSRNGIEKSTSRALSLFSLSEVTHLRILNI